MKIDMFQDSSVFEAITPEEWNILLASAATNVIFLTWEWQSTWWKHMSPGEMLVITYRDTAGQLQGIVPLFRFQSDDGSWTLSIIGCEDVSDYLDLIVSPKQEKLMCSELLNFLASDHAPYWDKIQLCNLPATSTACRVLSQEARTRTGLSVTQRVQDICPIIDLPLTWENYLGSLRKKQRHEIRRKMRRAESEAVTHWYVVDAASYDLSHAMREFVELHRLSGVDKGAFMDSKMAEFFYEMANLLASRGWLYLTFIEMNGRKAASLLAFDYNNCIQVYNSGYDPSQYGHLSPGIVLWSYCIQDAIRRGRSEFDFLRGQEQYKFSFGARPTEIYELEISRQAEDATDSAG